MKWHVTKKLRTAMGRGKSLHFQAPESTMFNPGVGTDQAQTHGNTITRWASSGAAKQQQEGGM